MYKDVTSVYYEDRDMERPVVLWGWDAWSRAVYIYFDERSLPHWKRTHIIKP